MSTGERPAKRSRNDADVDAESPVVRSTDYWFDDGSIILQAENTQFRVGKSLLARHSSVFADMLSLPPAAEPLVEGCPVVLLPGDLAEDWGHLLDAMYPNECYSEKVPTLNALAGVLRLSKKYDIPSFRAQCIARLKAEFPSDYTVYRSAVFWTKIEGPDESALFQITIQVANLARELGIYSILPITLYNATAGYTVEENSKPGIFDDVFRNLDIGDQLSCLIAHAKLMHAFADSEGPLKWIKSQRYIPSKDCKHAASCTAVRNRLLSNMTGEEMVSILDEWDTNWETGLCADCVTAAKEVHSSEQEESWEKLPSFFGLPDWGELLKMDLE